MGAFAIGGGTGDGLKGARDTAGADTGIGAEVPDEAEAAWAAVLTGGMDGEWGAG
jgi:hypothetical protein